MNQQEIINKLKNSNLFSFNNEYYTERFLNFVSKNKQSENNSLNQLFASNNTYIIRNFFSDVQSDGNIWYGAEELAEFANVSYDEGDNVDDVCSVFMLKIKRLLNCYNLS